MKETNTNATANTNGKKDLVTVDKKKEKAIATYEKLREQLVRQYNTAVEKCEKSAWGLCELVYNTTNRKEVKNDKECQELADKLDKAIQAKFGDTEKTEKSVDVIVNKIKKSDVVPDGNEKDSKKDKKEDTVEKVKNKSSLGTGEDENKAVTTKQEKTAITNEIKDDTDFFKQIVAITNGKVDGETLRDSLVNLINKSFKNEAKDKDGKTIYTWKKDIKGFQTKNEENLIKGLGAVLCGLIAINHKGMNEEVLGKLIDYGFKADDFLNNLKK